MGDSTKSNLNPLNYNVRYKCFTKRCAFLQVVNLFNRTSTNNGYNTSKPVNLFRTVLSIVIRWATQIKYFGPDREICQDRVGGKKTTKLLNEIIFLANWTFFCCLNSSTKL